MQAGRDVLVLAAQETGATLYDGDVENIRERFDELDREGLRIHFIGTLQRNKVKYIIDKVCMIHSLDSLSLAAEIEKQASKQGIVMDVLVEINSGLEESKSGLRPDEVEGFFRRRAFCGINITIPYKQVIIPMLDELTDVARDIGAVNTVVNRDGRLIGDNTGLPITLLLSHKQGGHQQINARIAYNEIDLVLLFADPNNTDHWDDSQMIETIRHCDKHNVPIATNLASAEMFIMGLQRGDLDWREMLHSKPRY